MDHQAVLVEVPRDEDLASEVDAAERDARDEPSCEAAGLAVVLAVALQGVLHRHS